MHVFICMFRCVLNPCNSLSSPVYREPNEIFKFKNHRVKTRERKRVIKAVFIGSP